MFSDTFGEPTGILATDMKHHGEHAVALSPRSLSRVECL